MHALFCTPQITVRHLQQHVPSVVLQCGKVHASNTAQSSPLSHIGQRSTCMHRAGQWHMSECRVLFGNIRHFYIRQAQIVRFGNRHGVPLVPPSTLFARLETLPMGCLVSGDGRIQCLQGMQSIRCLHRHSRGDFHMEKLMPCLQFRGRKWRLALQIEHADRDLDGPSSQCTSQRTLLHWKDHVQAPTNGFLRSWELDVLLGHAVIVSRTHRSARMEPRDMRRHFRSFPGHGGLH